MRIGVDASCWANDRGYGRFTREIVTAMAALAPQHEFVCILDPRSADVFALTGANVRQVVVPQSLPPTIAAASGSQRSPIDMLRLTMAVARAHVDVFFSPAVYSFFPLPPGQRAVVTVHDAIAERFPSMTLPSRRDRWFWKLKVGLALRQAALILTVSDYAADDIVRHLGVHRARIRVSLEGVAAAYYPGGSEGESRAAALRAGVPEGVPWIMYVGGIGPHKHVDRLIKAHANLVQRCPERPPMLLLVGAEHDGFYADRGLIQHTIDECGTQDLVRWTGYLSDDELRPLHTGAVALALVSASEGFGLPAVEAAMCGTPVVATTESPLPQILRGGGIFVPPGDAAAIEEALYRLLTNAQLRIDLGRGALAAARALSWPASARVALDALEAVAQSASLKAE